MLTDFLPPPGQTRPLPPRVAAEQARQTERLRRRLTPAQWAAVTALPGADRAPGLSDFISGTLFMYPAAAVATLQLATDDEAAYVRSLKATLARELTPTLPDAELKHRLRQWRRCYLLPWAWRDLIGAERDPLRGCRLLAAVAEAVVGRTLTVVRAALAAVYGEPRAPDGSPLPLLTVGMGKLGGEELNFSSDLDLVFTYPGDGETDGGARRLSHGEFFTRMVRRAANLLADQTADSFAYRIDLRLRPFGDAGALVYSFDGLANYYETQGRTWERYAWVKARILNRDPAVEPYARELEALLRPFVYRRYLDYGAIDSLRKLKRTIESELRRRRLEHNFKLGAGGIREIEFIAQVFQLMRGGRTPALQERNLVRTLTALVGLQLLPATAGAELTQAYRALRRLENVVQELSDLQTQELPRRELDRERTVYALGCADWDAAVAALQALTGTVHAEFGKIFAAPVEAAPESQAAEVWESGGPEDELTELLRQWRPDLPQAPELARVIAQLRRALGNLPVGPVGRETLRRLMPRVIELIAAARSAPSLLQKVGRLITQVALRTTYLQLLESDEQILRRVIALLQDNAFAADLISAHPILLDELIAPHYLTVPPTTAEFAAQLREQLLRLPPEDLEQQMEELRLFKKSMVLRVAMSDQSGSLPLMKISDALTWLAEAVVRQLLTLAWTQCAAKYGAPAGRDATAPGLTVVAYGKLGGLELGYKSDLDMVFIREDREPGLSTSGGLPEAVFYQRVVQRLLHLCTTRTANGSLYDLDMRLRPDGNAGLLVTDLSGYAAYQQHRAWTWEHQALVRARAIAGSADVAAGFAAVRERVLRTPRRDDELRAQVLQMRAKMREHLDHGTSALFDLKHGPGGMVDIEFIAQYLLLREAPRHPDMVLWTDNVRIFEECTRVGAMSAAERDTLTEAYLDIRGWDHRLSLADLPRLTARADRPAACARVEAIWRRVFS